MRFHKIYKHYVSKIDYTIRTLFKKPMTASQKYNLERHEKIAQMRDNPINQTQTEDDLWSD